MYFMIYKITNNISGKIYIGKQQSTVQNEMEYFGSGKLIKSAIKKYGREFFSKEILLYCESMAELNEIESMIVCNDFIKRKDTYNLNTGRASAHGYT